MCPIWIDPVKKTVTCEHHMRPSDLDSLGHVNNAVALELFEMGRLEWSKVNRVCVKDNLIPVVTRLNVSYNREIFVEPVKIDTTLVNGSFFELEFKQEVYTHYSEGGASLEGTIFVSLLDQETKSPQRLKDCFVPSQLSTSQA